MKKQILLILLSGGMSVLSSAHASESGCTVDLENTVDSYQLVMDQPEIPGADLESLKTIAANQLELIEKAKSSEEYSSCELMALLDPDYEIEPPSFIETLTGVW